GLRGSGLLALAGDERRGDERGGAAETGRCGPHVWRPPPGVPRWRTPGLFCSGASGPASTKDRRRTRNGASAPAGPAPSSRAERVLDAPVWDDPRQRHAGVDELGEPGANERQSDAEPVRDQRELLLRLAP